MLYYIYSKERFKERGVHVNIYQAQRKLLIFDFKEEAAKSLNKGRPKSCTSVLFDYVWVTLQ